MAGSICLFSTLVSSIEHSQAEMMEVMEMNQRAAKNQADTMMRQLELEVKELRRRESALAELAQSDDFVSCMKVSQDPVRPDSMTHRRRAGMLDKLAELGSGSFDVVFDISRRSPRSAALRLPKTGPRPR